jgi:hypothetical protein
MVCTPLLHITSFCLKEGLTVPKIFKVWKSKCCMNGRFLCGSFLLTDLTDMTWWIEGIGNWNMGYIVPCVLIHIERLMVNCYLIMSSL